MPELLARLYQLSDMNLIDQFPRDPLPLDEETSAVKSDPQKVVMHTMREALKYTQRVSRDNIPEDERVSLCYRKLTMSVKRFIPGKLRFFAFAKAGLRGACKDYWTNRDTVRNATKILSVDLLSGWSAKKSTRDRTHRAVAPELVSPHKPIAAEDDNLRDTLRESYTGEITPADTAGIEARDLLSAVDRLLAGKLNDRQRMVLDLVYKSGLNYTEIAKLLSVTRSLIHAVHRDSINIIRAEIAKSGRLLTE